jgi:hypothetical protein
MVSAVVITGGVTRNMKLGQNSQLLPGFSTSDLSDVISCTYFGSMYSHFAMEGCSFDFLYILNFVSFFTLAIQVP